MKHVLAITGKAGSGKDTYADHLVEKHGFAKAQFSGPLKDWCCRLFKWDRARIDDYDYKEEQDPNLPAGWTRRKVLQFVGTNIAREIDPLFWVKLACEEIDSILRHPEVAGIVLADCRFLNEAHEACLRYGATVLRLEREGGPPVSKASGHASETEMDLIEPTLNLSVPWGQLDLLRAHADQLAEGWK